MPDSASVRFTRRARELFPSKEIYKQETVLWELAQKSVWNGKCSIQAAWNVGKWGELHPWEERDRPGDGRVRMGQGRRSAEVGRKREGKKGGGGEQKRVAKPVGVVDLRH
jgi:hypothetical protein